MRLAADIVVSEKVCLICFSKSQQYSVTFPNNTYTAYPTEQNILQYNGSGFMTPKMKAADGHLLSC